LFDLSAAASERGKTIQEAELYKFLKRDDKHINLRLMSHFILVERVREMGKASKKTHWFWKCLKAHHTHTRSLKGWWKKANNNTDIFMWHCKSLSLSGFFLIKKKFLPLATARPLAHPFCCWPEKFTLDELCVIKDDGLTSPSDAHVLGAHSQITERARWEKVCAAAASAPAMILWNDEEGEIIFMHNADDDERDDGDDVGNAFSIEVRERASERENVSGRKAFEINLSWEENMRRWWVNEIKWGKKESLALKGEEARRRGKERGGSSHQVSIYTKLNFPSADAILLKIYREFLSNNETAKNFSSSLSLSFSFACSNSL
jgi:hypothetical protein